MNTHRLTSVILLGLAACTASAGGAIPSPGTRTSTATAPDAGAPLTANVPSPLTAHPACIVSADCPAGEYCDLEQCVQDCNTADPCTGALTCSPRAKCVAPGMPDVDPTPTGQSQGILGTWPLHVQLTDRDTSFSVTLTSSGTAPVRYRTTVSGPHLALANASGTFTGSTKLTVNVDPAAVTGRNQDGAITIYTSLGTAVVDAPIHAGITGSYKGRLQYDGGPINLGTSQVALDVIENAGAVQLRADAEDSLLFPAINGQATTGQGIYTVSGGLDATLAQVVPTDFGGDRNPFGRDIGRQVRFQVQPDSMGGLSGTFTETIVGLFSEPVMTTGHVSFQYVPQTADPTFSLAPTLAMPAAPDKHAPADLGAALATVLNFTDGTACIGLNLASYQAMYQTPSLDNFMNQAGGASYDDISSACQAVMQEATPDTSAGCGVPQELAYAMACGAQTVSPSDLGQAQAVGGLVEQMLAAPLIVAKNEVVDAVQASFTSGPSIEESHYDTAMTALMPYATWLFEPVVIEFLRSMPPEAAAGPMPDPSMAAQTQVQPYPALRSIADLFKTMAAVDAERVRIDAATTPSSATAHDTAQERALLSYLELASLSELMNDAGTVPDSFGVAFTGALTPMDQSFAGLLEGANAFGIPDDFVPFVYRPEEASTAPTNFEQVLLMARAAVATEQTDETALITEAHTYAAEVEQLKTELQNIKVQFDSQLQALCGASFDPDTITSPTSGWSSCGANNTGAVGEGLIGIDAANAALATAQAGIQGQAQKLQADVGALAESDQVQAQTINAVWQDGQEIAADDLASGILGAINQSISIAANAQVWNGGAPLAEAAIALVIGGVQAQLAQNKDQYEADQQLQIETGQKDVSDIQAETNITKDRIDMDQAVIALNQEQIGVLSANAQVSDKVAQAQNLWQLRAAQMLLVTQDPTKDPSYRTLRDATALKVLAERASAQESLYMAASALAYELNSPVPNISGAVINANDSSNMNALASCLQNIFDTSRYAFGSPQGYLTTVSVRQMLGIVGPRADSVTGQTLSEGDQFRQILLQNANLDGRGGVGITFSTNLQPGNGLWASDVCEDRIASVQAQLVGDFLGDNQAQVNIALGGGGVLRSCGSDDLVTWSFGQANVSDPTAFAVVQAGVNTYGTAPPNAALFGQPVARANWQLTIPGGVDAPSNLDVDITHIDDIVLNIAHSATAQHTSPIAVDFSCLSAVGN